MRNSLPAAVFLATLLSAAPLHSQEAAPKIVVKTFSLQSLSPKDAAALVSPYTMFLGGGGVFEAGGALRAITVRATPEILARVDSILRANDHARATILLRFQLIAASDSAIKDAAIGAVDAELRNLFRFAGYRLLSQGSATVNEGENFTLTMSGVTNETLKLFGDVQWVQATGAKGTVHLNISLEHRIQTFVMGTPTASDQTLLSTGLTTPLGQTVVLGSAAYGAPIPAIILSVRPEVAGRP